MYIFLDEDINNIDFLLYPQYIDSIGQLISSTCCGCNILDAKRSTFKFLIESTVFSKNQVKNIEEIMRHNYEYNDLFQNAPYKIIVSSTASSISRNDNIWILPLSSIEYGSLQSVELLAEDLTDGQLLIHSVDHYKKLNGYNSLSYKITPRNGGGTNIYSNLINVLENSKDFTIVFCDSDKFSPEANLGDTTQKCIELSNSHEKFSFFMKTKGREIENDLPITFVIESHIDDPKVQQRIQKLEYVKSKLDIPFMDYIDLKEGLRTDWISKFEKNTKNFEFWGEFNLALSKINYKDFNNKFSQDESETILPMICEKMASNTLDWLDDKKKNHPKSIHSQIKKDAKAFNSWLEHGKDIFWLGCAMKKIRL